VYAGVAVKKQTQKKNTAEEILDISCTSDGVFRLLNQEEYSGQGMYHFE
jgi:hypothetical protein